MQDTRFATLVLREPWRQRIGFPNTVDDPLFIARDHIWCDGEIEYEGGESKYWKCKKCGYVGWATVIGHYPVMSPHDFYAWCKEFFLSTRREDADECMDEEEIQHQMFYLMAIVLKQASTKKPHEIRSFADSLLRL